MDRKIQRCGLTYSGKTVLITGGSKGIGEGCARVFCDAGANVVLCARGQETGARLAAELDARGPGKCAFFPCDVGDTEQIARLVRDTVSRFGRLDCLINNAGYHPAHKRIDDFSCEALREILNVNLVSYFAASKYALEHIRKTRGTIINMSSLVGQIGQEQATIYCASKGAITAFSKALAIEEAPEGVRVVSVSPGNIVSDSRLQGARAARDPDRFNNWLDSHQVTGRSGTNEEVGQLCLFLASDAASFLTGIDVIISGGAEIGYGVKFPPHFA